MNSQLSYSQWKNKHASFLETLRVKHVILLFSGGNDSSLAMDFLLRAAKDFDFRFEAHAGAFPTHRYSNDEKNKLSLYWSKRGASLVWHQPPENDDNLSTAEVPCIYCQEMRKRMLKTFLPELVPEWKKLVLITSYSLWDLVSYSIEHILANLLSNPKKAKKSILDKRHMETSQRFYPVLTMKEGYTVFRPLIKCNGDEIRELLTKTGIPTLSIPCKFADSRPKRILEEYYRKMGLRFDYDRLASFREACLDLPEMTAYTSLKKEEYLRHLF